MGAELDQAATAPPRLTRGLGARGWVPAKDLPLGQRLLDTTGKQTLLHPLCKATRSS